MKSDSQRLRILSGLVFASALTGSLLDYRRTLREQTPQEIDLRDPANWPTTWAFVAFTGTIPSTDTKGVAIQSRHRMFVPVLDSAGKPRAVIVSHSRDDPFEVDPRVHMGEQRLTGWLGELPERFDSIAPAPGLRAFIPAHAPGFGLPEANMSIAGLLLLLVILPRRRFFGNEMSDQEEDWVPVRRLGPSAGYSLIGFLVAVAFVGGMAYWRFTRDPDVGQTRGITAVMFWFLIVMALIGFWLAWIFSARLRLSRSGLTVDWLMSGSSVRTTWDAIESVEVTVRRGHAGASSSTTKVRLDFIGGASAQFYVPGLHPKLSAQLTAPIRERLVFQARDRILGGEVAHFGSVRVTHDRVDVRRFIRWRRLAWEDIREAHAEGSLAVFVLQTGETVRVGVSRNASVLGSLFIDRTGSVPWSSTTPAGPPVSPKAAQPINPAAAWRFPLFFCGLLLLIAGIIGWTEYGRTKGPIESVIASVNRCPLVHSDEHLHTLDLELSRAPYSVRWQVPPNLRDEAELVCESGAEMRIGYQSEGSLLGPVLWVRSIGYLVPPRWLLSPESARRDEESHDRGTRIGLSVIGLLALGCLVWAVVAFIRLKKAAPTSEQASSGLER